MAQTDLNLNPLLFLPQKCRDKSVSHQADFILLLLWEVALGSRRNKKMCPQEPASITAISSRVEGAFHGLVPSALPQGRSKAFTPD